MKNKIKTGGKNVILELRAQALDKDDPRYDECPCCGQGYLAPVRRCDCQFSWLPHPMYRGYCPECKQSMHFRFDHTDCFLTQMERCARRMGEDMAIRHNQVLLGLLEGPEPRVDA